MNEEPTDNRLQATGRRLQAHTKKQLTLILRVVIVLLALLGGWEVWSNIQTFPRTDDAEIRANTIGVSPQVGGAIVELHVLDNQYVKRGQLLMVLDARPYEAEAARAKARLELVRLEVKALQDQIAAAKATLKDREAKAIYATDHYERMKPLLQGNFASIDKVQQCEAEAASAQALVNEAKAAVTSAENTLGELNGKNTRIEEAAAAYRDAELKVSYCKVYAPCDGYVTDLQIAPGSYAATGQQVFTIVDSTIWYVIAYFREIDIHRIKAGQTARVYLMAKNRQPLNGIVQGIARGVFPLVGASHNQPASQGVLSVVPPTFDFIQLATRFPVRIVLQGTELFDFRMGGKASVIVDTRNIPKRGTLQLLQEPERNPFVSPVHDESTNQPFINWNTSK